MVVIGLAVQGWKHSPYFFKKTDFLVVVFGIPLIALVLQIGWLVVRPKVVANTGDRLKAVWSDTGPTYGTASVNLDDEAIDPLLLPPIDPDLLDHPNPKHPRRKEDS
jgi:L-asparagine permease